MTNYLMHVRVAPVLLSVGLLMMLLYARNQFHRSRESALEGERRSVEVTVDAAYGAKASMKATVTKSRSVCFNEDPSPNLEQFVDALPIIPHVNISDGQQHVVRAYKTTQVSLSSS